MTFSDRLKKFMTPSKKAQERKEANRQYWASMPRCAKPTYYLGVVALAAVAIISGELLISVFAFLFWSAAWEMHRTKKVIRPLVLPIAFPVAAVVLGNVAFHYNLRHFTDESLQDYFYAETLMNDPDAARAAAQQFYDQVESENVYLKREEFPSSPLNWGFRFLNATTVVPSVNRALDLPDYVEPTDVLPFADIVNTSELFAIFPKDPEWTRGRDLKEVIMFANCYMKEDGSPLRVTMMPNGNALNAAKVPEFKKVAEACTLASSLADEGMIEERPSLVVTEVTPEKAAGATKE